MFGSSFDFAWMLNYDGLVYSLNKKGSLLCGLHIIEEFIRMSLVLRQFFVVVRVRIMLFAVEK